MIGYGLKSGADQKGNGNVYARQRAPQGGRRELQLYKARIGAKYVILNLVFGEANTVAPLLRTVSRTASLKYQRLHKKGSIREEVEASPPWCN